MNEKYRKPAVVLHWAMAALFLGSYLSVYYRHWFTEKGTPENYTAVQLHIAIGITIGLLAIPRIIWRLRHKPPALPPGPVWQHGAATLMHWALYACIVVMPISGYLGTKAVAKYLLVVPSVVQLPFYDWLVTETFGLTWKAWEAPLDVIHKGSGKYVVWVLIAIHVGAALYHQFHKRDGLLRRMTL